MTESRRFAVYGVTVATDVDLTVPLPPSDAPVDCVFDLALGPPESDVTRTEPVYLEGGDSDGAADFAFYALPDRDVIRIASAMEFHCWPDRIVCHLLDRRHRYLVEIALFGMVLALWLERRGTLTFHASTVVVCGQAIAFMADKGGGKTSTAAACIRAGYPLLSDDLLALRVHDGSATAQPGFPQLRMWPDQASYFTGAGVGHAPFHPGHDKRRVDVGSGFGRFAAEEHPIRRFYVPHRGSQPDGPVRIDRLSPSQAALRLIRHSFLPSEMVHFGLQAGRLQAVADLLRTVPVAVLTVPLGLDQLPRVVAAIEADVLDQG